MFLRSSYLTTGSKISRLLGQALVLSVAILAEKGLHYLLFWAIDFSGPWHWLGVLLDASLRLAFGAIYIVNLYDTIAIFIPRLMRKEFRGEVIYGEEAHNGKAE